MKEGLDRKEKKSRIRRLFLLHGANNSEWKHDYSFVMASIFCRCDVIRKVLEPPRPLGPPTRTRKTNDQGAPTRTRRASICFHQSGIHFFSLARPLFFSSRRGCLAPVSDVSGFQATASPPPPPPPRRRPSRVIKRTNRKRRDPVKASPKRKGVRLRPYRRWPLRSATPARPFGYLSRVVLSIAPLSEPRLTQFPPNLPVNKWAGKH